MHFHGKNAENVTGGLKQRKIQTKSIRHYATEPADSGTGRCVVSLFQKYIALIGGEGAFYRRPLDKLNFSKQPMGIHKLSSVIKEMCSKAGLTGNCRLCHSKAYSPNFGMNVILGIRTRLRLPTIRHSSALFPKFRT